MSIDLIDHLHIIEDIARSRRLLLALDFDGTLAPICADPAGVQLPPESRSALEELLASYRVTVAVVSGRSLYDLSGRVPLGNVILAGNHGFEIRAPLWSYTHADAAAQQPALHHLCKTLSQVVADFQGASIEDKRLTATVHYRGVDESRRWALKRLVRECVSTSNHRYSIRSANMALEIRPRISWDKGSAVQLVRSRMGLDAAPCICIGDDRTDESMFLKVVDSLSVVVNPRFFSAAKYRLSDCTEVCNVLSLLSHFVRTLDLRCERSTCHYRPAEAAWGAG